MIFPFFQAPAFPDNPSARFMSELVATINSGDRERIRRFADARLDDDPLLGLGPANHARRLGKIYEGSGGLKLERIDRDGTALVARTVKGDRLVVLIGGLGPKSKGGFEFRRITDVEETSRGYAWPKDARSESAVIGAVRIYLDRLAKRDLWNGVLLVAKGDRVLLHTAHGLAERDYGAKIRKDTKFNLASLGKSLTAVVVGGYVQEGRLSLDDKLGKYRPDWPDAEAREKITVRMLLNHTAGLGGLFDSPGYDRTRRYFDATDLTTALYVEPLSFPPGTAWNYSNGGYAVLGSILEKIEGKPYETIMRERLFVPLGMRDSGWADTNEVLPNMASLYDRDVMDPLGLEPKRLSMMFAGWRGGPHGGGYSTAEDLFRFARAFRKGRLLNPSLTKEFLTPVGVAEGPRDALGFFVEDLGGMKSYGHNGHCRADLGILWEEDVTVIALGNDLSEPTPIVAGTVRRFLAKSLAAK